MIYSLCIPHKFVRSFLIISLIRAVSYTHLDVYKRQGLYQVGKFPSWNRWAEWNGRYRDDIRRYLKGDEGTAGAAALRIAGSSDIYDPSVRDNASVNFITCHDGFTLYDLYSYNVKHNESNGWNNTDGSNDNHSWNCGAEGETEDKAVNTLRRRMIRNACAVLMCLSLIHIFVSGKRLGIRKEYQTHLSLYIWQE